MVPPNTKVTIGPRYIAPLVTPANDMTIIELNWVKPKGSLESARFRLLRDHVIHGIVVPGGFATDGASLPRAVRVFLSPFGTLLPAAIVHDYLLSLRGHTDVGRQFAAHRFREVLKAEGVAIIPRQLAYWGVRSYDRWLKLTGKTQ